MDDKMEQLRYERLKNKKPTYDEQHMMAVYKALNSEQAAGKYKQQSKSKERMAAVQADKSIGIETRKSSPVKSNRGASRGGALSKKDRETNVISGDIVAGRNVKDSQWEKALIYSLLIILYWFVFNLIKNIHYTLIVCVKFRRENINWKSLISKKEY